MDSPLHSEVASNLPEDNHKLQVHLVYETRPASVSSTVSNLLSVDFTHYLPCESGSQFPISLLV